MGMEQAWPSVTAIGVLRWSIALSCFISNNVFVSPVWTLWECLCCVCILTDSLRVLSEASSPPFALG